MTAGETVKRKRPNFSYFGQGEVGKCTDQGLGGET